MGGMRSRFISIEALLDSGRKMKMLNFLYVQYSCWRRFFGGHGGSFPVGNRWSNDLFLSMEN